MPVVVCGVAQSTPVKNRSKSLVWIVTGAFIYIMHLIRVTPTWQTFFFPRSAIEYESPLWGAMAAVVASALLCPT